jgi:hypothetical protein
MVPQSQPVSALPRTGEIAAGELVEILARHAGKPLLFRYEGRDVLPGYHVTEVKSGTFEALDCGANHESWRETFIQLWDVPPEDGRGQVTFEVSNGTRAMQLYYAAAVAAGDDSVRVELTARPASCKPRDRWLAEQATACCAPQPAAARCCG